MNDRYMLDMPKYIVVHHTVIPVSYTDKQHLDILQGQNTRLHGSAFGGLYHKVVLPSGLVKTLVPVGRYAPHIDFNKGEYYVNNDNAIGIAVSYNGNVDQMTGAQWKNLVNEVAWMQREYHIESIKPHRDINPTACPGNLFPFDTLLSEVKRTLEVGGESTVRVFMDVENERWSKIAIEYVKNCGLMRGYEDGTFRPEDSLTREEMAAILYNLSNLKA